MSHQNRTRLNKIADLLQSSADGLVACLEIVIGDHAGKRPRRSHRIITRRVYHRAPRQVVYRPMVVKVIREKEL